MGNITVSERQLEVSLVWAMAEPKLFMLNVVLFFSDHPAAEWDHTTDNSREGFLTFVAQIKEKDHERG